MHTTQPDADVHRLMTVLDPQRIRTALGPEWLSGNRFGDDCWVFDTENPDSYRRVIVSMWNETEPIIAHGAGHTRVVPWIHASMSYSDERIMPTYDDLCLMHRAVFPGFAYQVFAPPEKHIDIRHNVLHLWGRVDGKPAMPDFGRHGTI